MECDAMLTVQLTCPLCSRILRCQRLIAPGERLRCSHCGGQFRAGTAPAPSEARRGALLGWLLFANLLVLAGVGLTVAIVFSQRGRADNAAAQAVNTIPSAPAEESTPSARIEPPPPAPLLAPPPAPASKPTPPSDPPPPPLPEPPRPQTKPSPPAKEKKTEPEKRRAPASPRRETSPAPWLPVPVQKQVERSLEGGIEFLRREQHADGSWGHQTGPVGKRFTTGITALCGLTLLECGVSPKDGQVRSAAHFLRRHMPDLTTTYSISLAILFFDRLDDKEDAARIRTLALRLLAGQKPSGGWDYYCPKLRDDEELGLLARLYKDRPTSALDLFANEPNSEDKDDIYRPKPSKTPPLELFVAQGSSDKPPPESKSEEPPPQVENRKPKADSRSLPGDSRLLSQRAREAADKLPESLRKTPALRAAELLRGSPNLREPRTDNSNTQFAILGLLTAENHDVPMERALALIDWRFRNSMTAQQGWNYLPTWQTSPSMTAAALMGLALKHGLLLPNRRNRGRNVAIHDDDVMHRGFLTLKGLLENYFTGLALNPADLNKLDLYCLWTVERVAVLYNLRSFGTLDWYPAGVQLLLPLQREDGSWNPKGTTCLEEPPVATSFALLFLKRSNLARDLTDRLNAAGD
jgi:hypothetical protein